jgi:hypothetical protein
MRESRLRSAANSRRHRTPKSRPVSESRSRRYCRSGQSARRGDLGMAAVPRCTREAAEAVSIALPRPTPRRSLEPMEERGEAISARSAEIARKPGASPQRQIASSPSGPHHRSGLHAGADVRIVRFKRG